MLRFTSNANRVAFYNTSYSILTSTIGALFVNCRFYGGPSSGTYNVYCAFGYTTFFYKCLLDAQDLFGNYGFPGLENLDAARVRGRSMFKNVAQKLYVYAFDQVNGVGKTGDAANITCRLDRACPRFLFFISVCRRLEYGRVNLARLSMNVGPRLIFVLSARRFPVESVFESWKWACQAACSRVCSCATFNLPSTHRLCAGILNPLWI